MQLAARFALALLLALSSADAALAASDRHAKPGPDPADPRSAGAEKPTTAPAPKPARGPFANATADEVKARLGEPAVANAEGKGAMWTYRLEGCALMVFFRDDGKGLRVSGVAAGPRRRADPVPDPEACIAEARRSP